MINFSEIDRLISLSKRAEMDPLIAFVAADPKGSLEELRQNYLNELLSRAKKYGTRFIYIGKGEIAGCEYHKVPDNRLDKTQTTHKVSVMWVLAEEMGFPASCGNGDQYQCMGSERVFPEDSYGGWDLETMTKLTEDETTQKKFFRVVTRKQYA